MKKIVSLILVITNLILLILSLVFSYNTSSLFDYLSGTFYVISLVISLIIVIILFKENIKLKLVYLITFFIFTIIVGYFKTNSIAFALGFSMAYFIFYVIAEIKNNKEKATKYITSIIILSIIAAYLLLCSSLFPEIYSLVLLIIGLLILLVVATLSVLDYKFLYYSKEEIEV